MQRDRQGDVERARVKEQERTLEKTEKKRDRQMSERVRTK